MAHVWVQLGPFPPPGCSLPLGSQTAPSVPTPGKSSDRARHPQEASGKRQVTRKQLLDTWGLDANVRDTGGDTNHTGTGAGQGPGLASGSHRRPHLLWRQSGLDFYSKR